MKITDDEIVKEFDELVDTLPKRVSETPRQVLSDFLRKALKEARESEREGLKTDTKTITKVKNTDTGQEDYYVNGVIRYEHCTSCYSERWREFDEMGYVTRSKVLDIETGRYKEEKIEYVKTEIKEECFHPFEFVLQ